MIFVLAKYFFMDKNTFDKEFRYDWGADRFMDYFMQVYLVQLLKPKNLLEIGIGNSIITSYFRRHKCDFTTIDIDNKTNPDVIGDVRKLPFKNNYFDTIIACEVLEHIPWKDLEIAFTELHRVSSQYVIISVPYSSIDIESIIKVHFGNKKPKRQYFDYLLRIPLFFKDFSFDGEHYWEMGRKGFSKNKFKKIFKEKFEIIKTTRPPLKPYHYFFILRKK